MKKFRFYIKDIEKARAEMRTWAGRVNVCIADVLAAGYIDEYICTSPEGFAARIGAGSWELIK